MEYTTIPSFIHAHDWLVHVNLGLIGAVVNAGATKILRLRQVLARIGCSRSQLYKLIARGEFKKQISLSVRSVGWLETDVDAYIESRVKASRGEQTAPVVATR